MTTRQVTRANEHHLPPARAAVFTTKKVVSVNATASSECRRSFRCKAGNASPNASRSYDVAGCGPKARKRPSDQDNLPTRPKPRLLSWNARRGQWYRRSRVFRSNVRTACMIAEDRLGPTCGVGGAARRGKPHTLCLGGASARKRSMRSGSHPAEYGGGAPRGSEPGSVQLAGGARGRGLRPAAGGRRGGWKAHFVAK